MLIEKRTIEKKEQKNNQAKGKKHEQIHNVWN